IGDDVFDVLVLDGSRSELVLRSDFSAPSEPHASVVLQRRPQRHLEPAGARRAIPGGNRNPIGDDRQAHLHRPPTSQPGRCNQLSSGKRFRIPGANSTASCVKLLNRLILAPQVAHMTYVVHMTYNVLGRSIVPFTGPAEAA